MGKNKNRKSKPKTESVKCAFQVAVENTVEVKDGFCFGLQAIKHANRSKVSAADTKKLQGSLDIDTQTKSLYPNDTRWDYALSYEDKIYYVEIHPAETTEIDTVVNKIKWLKNWLKTKATEINKLPKAEHPYTWVQSGRYAILPTAKNMMKLSITGIVTTNKLSLK